MMTLQNVNKEKNAFDFFFFAKDILLLSLLHQGLYKKGVCKNNNSKKNIICLQIYLSKIKYI